jgi:hypothetical protein
MYRHRVTFKRDTSPDGNPDPSYTSNIIPNWPCDIRPVSGGERVRGKQLQAETKVLIETRYSSLMRTTDIAVNDVTAEQYLINNIIDIDGRKRRVMIECVEVS